MSYSVSVTDAAGQFNETSCTDWAHCLSVVRMMAHHYPFKLIEAYNLDNNCCCSDGLTDDERDEVDEARASGREGGEDNPDPHCYGDAPTNWNWGRNHG